MGRSRGLATTLIIVACAVAASAALFISTPKVAAPAVSTASRVHVSVGDENATRSVVSAARRLSASIRKARIETSTVLSASFASLASRRAQLAAEQQQIDAEVALLSAKASALASESAALQREATALHANTGTTPVTQPRRHEDN